MLLQSVNKFNISDNLYDRIFTLHNTGVRPVLPYNTLRRFITLANKSMEKRMYKRHCTSRYHIKKENIFNSYFS